MMFISCFESQYCFKMAVRAEQSTELQALMHKTKLYSSLLFGCSLDDLVHNLDLVNCALSLLEAALCVNELQVNDGFQSVK